LISWDKGLSILDVYSQDGNQMRELDVIINELIIIVVVPPIDLSTLYQKTDTRLPGNGKPYLYSRLGHVNRTAVE
jgi:hypothetical protein